MPQTAGMTFDLQTGAEARARVVLDGRLTVDSIADVWARIVEPLRTARTKDFTVEASNVTYCDGAGVGLFVELQRIAMANGGRAQIVGLSDDLEALVRSASLYDFYY